MATVTQESFESQYYITRALFGTRSLFAMTQPSRYRLNTSVVCSPQAAQMHSCQSSLSGFSRFLESTFIFLSCLEHAMIFQCKETDTVGKSLPLLRMTHTTCVTHR